MNLGQINLWYDLIRVPDHVLEPVVVWGVEDRL